MTARTKKTASVSVSSSSSTVDQKESAPVKTRSKKSKSTPSTHATSTHDSKEGASMKTQSATIPASIAATATTTTPVASGALAALPAGNAPAAPADFVASRLGRMVRPVRAQIDLTPKVVTELQSCADYTQLFGSAAPSVDSVVDALTLAKAWSGKLQNATAWYQFVKQEEHLAWKQALARTAALRVPFEFRLVRDASLAEDMPSTAAFFAITSDRAQKGAATRKEATAKEVKAAKATNAAAAAAPAAAPASAVVSDPVKAAALRLLN